MKTIIRCSVILLLFITTLNLNSQNNVELPVSALNDSLYHASVRDSSFQKISFSKQYICIASDSLKTATIDSLDNAVVSDSAAQTINYAEKNVYVARNTNKRGKVNIDTLQQKITYYEPLKASFHWFVTGNLGALLYIGESDRRGPFENRIGPALDLGFGNWFTPHVGLRLMYSGIQARGHIAKKYANTTAQTRELVNDNWYKQKWNLHFYHIDLMIDVFGSAWEEAYKQRIYSLQPYASFGVLSSPEVSKPAFAMGVGINNVFRLNQQLNLNVDLKAVLAEDRLDTELNANNGLKYEGITYLTVGLTYKFKTARNKALRNIHVNNQYISYYQTHKPEPSNSLEEKIQEQVNAPVVKQEIVQADSQLISNPRTDVPAPSEMVNTTNTAPVSDAANETTNEMLFAGAPIFFEINSTTLSNRAKVSVLFIADAIKNAPNDKIFTVVGYSDKQTGSANFNAYVSEQRAKAVYNALMKEGVDKSKLKMEFKGGVETMYFGDYTLSRIVIVK